MSSGYKIEWLGYNEQEQYNCIWGHLVTDTMRDFAFWGVKGKTILFKEHKKDYHAFHTTYIPMLIYKHEAKGFKKIDSNHYEMICPGFLNQLEIHFMTAILADTIVRGEDL